VLAMAAVERVRTERLAHIALYGRWLMLPGRRAVSILRYIYLLRSRREPGRPGRAHLRRRPKRRRRSWCSSAAACRMRGRER